MAVGIWGALGTAAAAVGPVLGGVLVTYGHWSWIFFVNVPIGIVAVVVCAHRSSRAASARRQAEGGIDIPGIVISGVGLFCLTLALVEGNAWGWTSAGDHRPVRRRRRRASRCSCGGRPRTALADVPGQPAAHPLVHGRQHRRSCSSAWRWAGTFLMLVIFLVSVLGYTELRAAMALTIMPVHRADRRAQRRPPERPHRAPASRPPPAPRASPSASSCWRSSAATRTLWDVMWRVAFIGVGMGLAMPTLSAASMASLPPQVRGVGSGSLNTMRQVGFTVGVALLVAIFTHTVAQNAQQATRTGGRGRSPRSRSSAPPRRARTRRRSSRTPRPRPSSGGGAAKLTTDPLQGAPQPPGRVAAGADVAEAQRGRRRRSTATTSPSRSLAVLRGGAGGADRHHPGARSPGGGWASTRATRR